MDNVDLSKKTVCIVDTGLALHMAPLLAKTFGRVLYHLPDSDAYRKTNRARIGTGIPNVERVKRLFDVVQVDQTNRIVDLFIFPDACMVDTQKHLRALGYPVVGCFDSDIIELNKEFFYQQLQSLGLPVAPYEIAIGIDDLRDKLDVREDWPAIIKLKNQEFRGITETFPCYDADGIDPTLDDIACILGRDQFLTEFLIQDCIPSTCEIGFDALQQGCEIADNPIVGIEGKDEWYIARVVPKLPPMLQEYMDKTAPIMGMLGLCGHRSTENRITDEGVSFGIDETIRVPSPPGELFPELYMDGDYAQAMWALGQGQVPSLRVKARCGVQLILTSSSLDDGMPVKVSFPPEIAPYVKLKNWMMEEDGSVWVIPNDNDYYLGAVVAVGASIEEAAAKVKEYASQIKAHKLFYEDDVLLCSADARAKAATFGVVI